MQSLAERIAALPSDLRAQALSKLTPAEADALLYDWRGFLARPEQLMPDGDWAIWLVLAGRGFGKTRTGAEAVREEVSLNRSERIGLIAETAADARDVMVAELMRIFPKSERPVYKSSKRLVEFNNGAVAFTYNATEPDQLRGPQHDFLWHDELCLIAGTMIEGERGPVPIERVCAGDLVWTRAGLRRVSAAWQSSPSAEVWEVVTRAGRRLVGTALHPVWVDGNGFAPLRNLSSGDMLLAWHQSARDGAGRLGISTAITTRTVKASSFIGKSISRLSDLCRRKWTCITSTATRGTTNFPTSSQLVDPNTCAPTNRVGSAFGPQRSGGATPAKTSGESAGRRSWFARIAAWSLKALGCVRGSVVQSVERGASASAIPDTLPDTVVMVRRLNDRAAVYNFEVEGEHEYFANGLLTHNCKWRYARETWDQAQFGLRLGQHPRQIVTTTPRPIELLKSIVAGSEGKVHITRGRTMDNRANLAASFMERIQQRYAGTRLGRQELEAEILGDLPGALWSLSTLDAYRLREAPDMGRIVVAVDPAVTATEDSDEHGIVVAGIADDQRGVVLEDASTSGSPMEWAKRAVSLYRSWQADGIVVEVNQGGDMVAHTLRTVDPNVKIIEVRASRGKHVRAEPIAALYEQGRVAHVGSFPELEAQMCVTGDTLIETQRGQVRIDQLSSADSVMTRKGFAPIHWVGYTGKAKRLVSIRTRNSELRVTECHPIYLPDLSDFVSAGNVSTSQSLLESANWKRQSLGGRDGFTSWPAVTIGAAESFYTGLFTKHTLGQSLRGITSTIVTKTLRTTSRAIWSLYCRLNTSISISALASMWSVPSLGHASFAAQRQNRFGPDSQLNTAAILARPARQEPQGKSQHPFENVKNAEWDLQQHEATSGFAVGFASSIIGCEVKPSDGEPVYNLSVADGHLPEYFANGILVHNCQMTTSGYEGDGSPDRVDALVWALSELFPEMTSRPQKVTLKIPRAGGWMA